MRTIWQSLAWKEWHEHKWKLAALVAITCGIATVLVLVAFFENNGPTDYNVTAMLLVTMAPLSVFIGAVEASSERAGQTMLFLQALPMPRWKAALWKLAFGIATCLIPILLPLLLVAGWCAAAESLGGAQAKVLWDIGNGRCAVPGDMLRFVFESTLFVSGLALSLLVWTAAIGVNRRSEVSAGALALLVIIFWWAAIFWLAVMADADHRIWLAIPMAVAPGGIFPLVQEGARWPGGPWLLAGIAVAGHVVLAAWYVMRFGRTESVATWSRASTRGDTARADWLAPPRRSPLTAVIWKQLRESGRLVLVGWAIVLPLAALTNQTEPGAALAVIVQGGFLLTIITGIGVFDRDLSPELNTFWRSRPINPDLWYWAKFLTGLVVLVAALGGPAVVIGLPDDWSWWYALPVVAFFCCVYATALGTMCLVRVTIYAAVLSIGAIVAVALVTSYLLHSAAAEVSVDRMTSFVLAMTTAAAVTLPLLGWLAVRRDWGWRR